ncbi:hypothetical protein ABEV54_18195 [Peribacillus psychrosaccharolyticus]|uniref:hypothetical protein n=1 Tax=Peribacillus psychrosaccharolyticus TaxID=1407 RepID=UPI003D273F2B
MQTELSYEQSIRIKRNYMALLMAKKRLDKSLEDRIKDDEIYASIGEVLLWLCTTDLWLEGNKKDYKTNRSKEKGSLISGLKHAYNCMKHNMTFFQIHESKGGLEFPLEFPLEILEIELIWTNSGWIQDARYANQIKNYEEYLEGKNIKETIEDAMYFLSSEFNSVIFPKIV